MAIFFMDSMAHYTNEVQGRSKIYEMSVGPNAGLGAFGAPANSYSFAINMNPVTTLEQSFYLKSQGSSSDWIILWTTGSSAQATIQLQTDGTFQLYRGQSGFSGVLIASSPANSIQMNVQHHLYIKLVLSATVGTIDIKVDGVSVLSATGLNNMSNTTYPNITQIGYNRYNNGVISHLALASASGDITGQPRVEALFPDGAGNYAQWTPLAGTNYTNVSEVTPDDDVAYNSSSTNGNRDSYTYSNMLAAPTSILAVALNPRIRKDDAATRLVRRFVRIAGVDYDTAPVAVPATYGYLQEVLPTNPATGVAWTPAQVNAIECGIKVES